MAIDIDAEEISRLKAPFEPMANYTSLGQVLLNPENGYLNPLALFITYFNAVPNYSFEHSINGANAHAWFVKQYREHIIDTHFLKTYFNANTKAEYCEVYYMLYDDLIVNIDINCSTVKFLFRNTDMLKVNAVINGIKRFKKTSSKRKPKIWLLVNDGDGLTTKSLRITKNKLSLSDNYNDDFAPIHQIIVKRLSTKNDKGLVLLHGKPGTGKTSYIRYLIATLKKPVIFLPPDIAASITNPQLMAVLIKNPNCVLVIEDAEKIIVDRERDGYSPVSTLLNISDGLLADCLNVQVICSFNTDISKIDSALMRKGRLIAKYEFKELAVDKAQQLSNKLKFITTIIQPTTLTDIYNQHDMAFQQTNERQRIGFGVNR
jgi:hypothetical protein